MNRAAEVQAWLESRADEMAALLEELVAIDTENPPGRGLGRCGRFLHDAMRAAGPFARADRARAEPRAGGPVHRARRRRRRPAHDLLPRPLRRRPGAGSGAVSPATARRQDHRTRHRRHEGRPGQHALRRRSRRASSGCSATAGSCCTSSATRRPAASPARDTSATAGLIDPERARDAHRRADRRRRSGTRAAARSRCASRPPGAKRTSATPTRGQRVRAHDPHRRAAHGALPRAARQANELPGRERGRPPARCSSSAARPAPAPASTPFPARRGSPSTAASTRKRSSSTSSRA